MKKEQFMFVGYSDTVVVFRLFMSLCPGLGADPNPFEESASGKLCVFSATYRVCFACT